MARYKYIDTNPRFLPVDLAKQLLPGTFEHAVHHLLEHTIDLSAFDIRFHNDVTGATAYPPSMLLQVVLCAYAHGIVSSRGDRARLPRARDVHRSLRGHSTALHDDRSLHQHPRRRNRSCGCRARDL